ncbi:MAG: hypothetical protein MI867_02180 [Pseudomonadales bacterium]|nr:hypothetical protein [Pseudomonadales bacterium]
MAGHGQLDVLDSSSRVQYRFGDRTSASSLSSGLWVDGNDVYFGYTKSVQSSGTARAVAVAKIQL